MHPSVLAWVSTALERREVEGRVVVEVGSYDVNGSVRPGLEALGPASYTGVDMQAGPGVDVIADAACLDETLGADSADIVISTEMLEHVREWQPCVAAMMRVVRPGGLLLVTTRSPGFPYHAFPEDHWRFPVESFCSLMVRAWFDVVTCVPDDPTTPGVFCKARKPSGWRWLGNHIWDGVDVPPVERPVRKPWSMGIRL